MGHLGHGWEEKRLQFAEQMAAALYIEPQLFGEGTSVIDETYSSLKNTVYLVACIKKNLTWVPIKICESALFVQKHMGCKVHIFRDANTPQIQRSMNHRECRVKHRVLQTSAQTHDEALICSNLKDYFYMIAFEHNP